MVTQSHRGRNELLPRLTAQVGDEGLARALLIKRGDMTKSGKLTAKGRKRDSMTAKERAVDRAAKASNKPKGAYTYNARSNRAVLKGKK